jgi:hypothetical protein
MAYFQATFTESRKPFLLRPEKQAALRAAHESRAEKAEIAAAPATTTVFTAAAETAAAAVTDSNKSRLC